MPIAIICGSCEAKLNAPDAAAGKRVKCPKCGVLLEIPKPEPASEPDFELIEDAPTMMMPPIKKGSVPKLPTMPPKPAAKAPPPAAKPKSKPVLLEEDDEDDVPPPPKKKPASKPAVVLDDDDEDDQPKPKKKGKKKPAAKSSTMLFAIIGGVVGVGLIGFLVYWFAIREPEVAKGPSGTGNNGGLQPGGPGPERPAPPPAGWKEFTGEGFVAVVPQDVQLQRNAQVEQTVSAKAPGAKVWMNLSPPIIFQVSKVKAPASEVEAFARDPDTALKNLIAKDREQLPPGAKIENETAVTIGGQKGRQFVLRISNPQLVTLSRVTVQDGFIVSYGASSQSLIPATDERVKAFFDGFRFTDGTAPQGGPGRPVPTRPGAGPGVD